MTAFRKADASARWATATAAERAEAHALALARIAQGRARISAMADDEKENGR